MKRMKMLTVLAAICLPGLALAGAAVGGTMTEERIDQFQPVRVALAWTSGTNDGACVATSAYVRGSIDRVVFAPGPTNGTCPTNLYDVTLKDAAGIDVLIGAGANLASNTVTQTVPGIPFVPAATGAVPVVVNDRLVLNVTNADFGKRGQVILYLK